MVDPSMDVPLPETYEEGDDVVEDDGPLSESAMLKQLMERLMSLEKYATSGFNAAGMEFDKQKKALEQEAMNTRNAHFLSGQMQGQAGVKRIPCPRLGSDNPDIDSKV